MQSLRAISIVLVWLVVTLHPASGAQAAVTTPEAQAACRAVLWLHSQQLPDGGFGWHLPDGSGSSSAEVTADVIYVLALLGENPAGAAWARGGRSPLDALATLTADYIRDAGQAGKIARAVALAGANPRAFGGLDLVGIIQQAYAPATGRYHPDYLYRHTLAVEGLLRAGQPVPQAALDALFQAQRIDGGWFWNFESDRSDVDSTGRVLLLLAGHAGVSNTVAYERTASFLAAAQTAAGGWGVYAFPDPNPANANSTALAVAGLSAAGFDTNAPRFQQNGRGGLQSLRAFQEESGAFVYMRESGKEEVRLMATVDALNALAPVVTARPVCRSLYLPLVLR